MTREEAIFYIKELQKTYASMDTKVAEAIDMAIEALSAEAVPLCDDCTKCTVKALNRPSADAEQTDCTDFIKWILEEVLDEENWELNAVANGEIICRKLKKLDLLEVKDGYYVRASVTPEGRTGEWIEQDDCHGHYYECSKCGIAVGLDDIRNYCPACGAKMGGDTE